MATPYPCLLKSSASRPALCSEGELYERQLKSGRVLLALFDPRMAHLARAHLWSERAKGGGGLFTETGPQAGRTHLARWTAEQCLLGGSGKLPLAVADWTYKDGCPANALARNLEVRLAAPAPSAGRAAAEATPPQHHVHQARQAARAALQQLYSAVGTAEGRRFMEALHHEHAALQQGLV